MKQKIRTNLVSKEADGHLDGNIDKIMEYLQVIKVAHPDCSNIEVVLDAGYNNISMDIYGWREETDQEYKQRLNREEKSAKNKEDKLAAKKAKVIQQAKELGLRIVDNST